MSPATDLAYALDPVRWAADAMGFDPDPWQAEVLRSNAGRLLLNCSRQSGKSTTTAALALHTAVYRPPTLVLLLSPSLRQSQELFKKLTDFYLDAGRPVPTRTASALRMELTNGSRIVSLPGDERTIRGYSGVGLLVVDEAARTADELYYSVRPMLAVSGGRLVALSTPFGKRGWWWTEWDNGGPAWLRVKITAEDCPRITDEFLEEERLALGTWWYRQEYECTFMDSQTAAFSWDMVQAATCEEVATWML